MDATRDYHGLPWWLSWSRICLKCRRPGFDPWVGKIPWRREWQPTPVFWPGEFHRFYSPWGHKELDMTEQLPLDFTSLFRDYHAKWSQSERDAFLPLKRKPCCVLCHSPVLFWLPYVPEGKDDVFSIYGWHTTTYSRSEMLSYTHMWLIVGHNIIDGQASSFIFRL